MSLLEKSTTGSLSLKEMPSHYSLPYLLGSLTEWVEGRQGLSLGLSRMVSAGSSDIPTGHLGEMHTLSREPVEEGSCLIVLGRNLYRL